MYGAQDFQRAPFIYIIYLLSFPADIAIISTGLHLHAGESHAASPATRPQIKSNQIKNIYCEMTFKQLLVTEIHNN